MQSVGFCCQSASVALPQMHSHPPSVYFTTTNGHWQRYVKIYVISADVNEGETCYDAMTDSDP